jgi:probable DNA repair protein
MDQKTLIGFMEEGGTVVTVNARLSRYLLAGFDAEMTRRGLLAWPTPEVHTLKSWYKSLWDGSRRSGAAEPMSEPRALATWEAILANDERLTALDAMLSDGLIKTSFDALELLAEYRIALPAGAIGLTEEAEALRRWKAAYEARVAKLDALCPTRLPDVVIKMISDGCIDLPGRVLFAGFDALSPRVSTLVKVVEARGVKVSFRPSGEGRPGLAIARSFPDPASETAEAARWIRSVFRPGMRIGVVAPDMSAYRDLIIREFGAELDPASTLMSGIASPSVAFNVSLALPLAACPPIKSALDIISMNDGEMPLEGLFEIVSSPYLSSTVEERLSIGRVDAELRKNHFALASLRDLLINDLAAPSLAARIKAWLGELKKRKADEKLRPSKWAKMFHDVLTAVGWPDRGLELSSVEWQAIEKWNGLLAAFAGLDDVSGNVDFKGAVKRLARMARQKAHQPLTPESPVQVMGLLESVGQTFDKLWILGAHERAFPMQASPNPFVPICLQREKGVPGSSHELLIDEASRMAGRLLSSAEEIIVSHPAVVEDRATKLSPIFAALAAVDDGMAESASQRARDALFAARADAVEEAAPDYRVEMDGAELLSIGGGTAILKEESACPFRAFALYRLRAKALDEPELGLDDMERGTLVHAALEIFWRAAKDSEGLKKLIESERLKVAIREAVDAALEAQNIKKRGLRHVVNIERERLERLLGDWLLMESERAPFRVVLEEARREASFRSGLKIRCKVDRVDETVDGTSVLIDYKTGETNSKDLLGERPKEPQLLAYARGNNFGAVAFGSVKAGKPVFKGFAERDDILPRIRASDDFNALVKEWEVVVERLADGFAGGDASVAPRKFFGSASPCKYCEFHGVCRVNEMHKRESIEDEA